MSYRQRNRINWGVAIACFIAVPLAFAWMIISIVGGGLVCADEAVHCKDGSWPLVIDISVIAIAATALGWVINLTINLIGRDH